MAEELSDVLLYLVRLADVVGVDPAASAEAKLRVPNARFAANDYQGVAPRKG